LEKGAICIVVTRRDKADQGVAGVDVALQGPSPGQAVTDAAGIAEFYDRTPGAYQYRTELPGQKYRGWEIERQAGDISVAAGQVSIGDVFIAPTGTLVVEIRDDKGSLIGEPADVRTKGPASMNLRVERGTHTFAQVPCGEYEVGASGSTKYRGWSDALPKVTVPEGGTVVAKIVVHTCTWIEIQLVGEDGAGIANEVYEIITPDRQVFRGKTDDDGMARVPDIVAGQCQISFPDRDGESWSDA
jgi:hypothetical protein